MRVQTHLSSVLFVCLTSLSALLSAAFVSAEDRSSAIGEVFRELPTLHCLGVRWKIKGDANRNGSVEVQFRKDGTKEWRKGPPLFRSINNEQKFFKEHAVPGGWMFAGSIVELEPDTLYEVKLTVQDPDGAEGEKTLKMKTWVEPKEPKGMVVKHVVPGDGGGSGTKSDPFKGLVAADAAAVPGTLFLLHKGVYIKDHCPGNTWNVTKDGELGKPIIYRAAGDGDVVLDGGGDFKTKGNIVGMGKRRHVWFEGLTVQGRSYAIVGHEGSNIVIRGCHFKNFTKGFVAHNGGFDRSQHFFIADNVFVGSTTWPRTKGIESFGGTKISGAGHVIAYNTMHHVGDGVHGTGYGSLYCSDYHNNEVFICTDDGLETDHAAFNIRVFHNRIVNVSHGITAQPIHGGPCYIFKNFIYNATYSPFKLHCHTTGVVIYHNTCLRNGHGFKIIPASETVTNVRTRNNLFLGTNQKGLYTSGRMRDCDFDSDGYSKSVKFLVERWNGKSWKTVADARAAKVIYKDRGAFFIDPATCFLSGMVPPGDAQTAYESKSLDYRLAEKSDAIDKGAILPGFNNGFKGEAPDLGALEFGEEMPYFGVRKKK